MVMEFVAILLLNIVIIALKIVVYVLTAEMALVMQNSTIAPYVRRIAVPVSAGMANAMGPKILSHARKIAVVFAEMVRAVARKIARVVTLIAAVLAGVTMASVSTPVLGLVRKGRIVMALEVCGPVSQIPAVLARTAEKMMEAGSIPASVPAPRASSAAWRQAPTSANPSPIAKAKAAATPTVQAESASAPARIRKPKSAPERVELPTASTSPTARGRTAVTAMAPAAPASVPAITWVQVPGSVRLRRERTVAFPHVTAALRSSAEIPMVPGDNAPAPVRIPRRIASALRGVSSAEIGPIVQVKAVAIPTAQGARATVPVDRERSAWEWEALSSVWMMSATAIARTTVRALAPLGSPVRMRRATTTVSMPYLLLP